MKSSLLGTSTIYTNIIECCHSETSITKHSYNTQLHCDNATPSSGPTQTPARAQGTGLGEHSNGWTSVLTCALVQEAACTPGHGCPRSLYHCPSTVLRNKGRCRITGPDRAGLSSLLIPALPFELGGRGLVLLGVPAWPCWHCP